MPCVRMLCKIKRGVFASFCVTRKHGVISPCFRNSSNAKKTWAVSMMSNSKCIRADVHCKSAIIAMQVCCNHAFYRLGTFKLINLSRKTESTKAKLHPCITSICCKATSCCRPGLHSSRVTMLMTCFSWPSILWTSCSICCKFASITQFVVGLL